MSCMECAADIETQNGELVCDNCAELFHSHCDGRDEWYRHGSSCSGCVTCDRCGGATPEADTVVTADGTTICDSCRRDWYWQCQECQQWNRDGRDCANGCCDPDNCSCDDCCDYDLDDDTLIHQYDYKPPPEFHGTGPLFLGPEIEIETPPWSREGCADIARSHLDDLGYLKEDGSILSGFEIVTHPMSYEWAITHFPWQMLTRLRDCGCVATENTGIHVHLSRTGFTSPCHTYRWMKFIYRNQHQVQTVARRCSPGWAAFTDDDRKAVKDYAKGARGHRYRAINTTNPDTFELRIFASSLDPDEVKAALGFAAASVEYTRDLTVDMIANAGGWTWPAFVAWLDQRPAYTPLLQQLKDLQCVC
jgi:hypothetical protein